MSINSQRSLLSLRMEWLALAVLVCCSFVIPISVTATTITFLLAWVLILCSGNWRERLMRLGHNPAALSFWVLFALFILGLVYTVSPMHFALKDLQKRHWMLIAPFFMMIIIDDSWRKRMINAFLAAVVLTLFLSYLKYFHIDIAKHIIHKRFSGLGIFFDHTVQYFFISFAAFIFGYRFFYQPKWKWFNALIFVLIAGNLIFLSRGRTGYVEFGLLALFLCFIRFRWKGLLSGLAIITVLFATAFTFSDSFHSRISSVSSEYQTYNHVNGDTSIGTRISMWHEATRIIKEHPWFGIGTGNLQTEMKLSSSPQMLKLMGTIDYVENSYLNFLIEFGVVGFIVFIGVLLIQIRMTFRLPTDLKYTMQAFLITYLSGALANSFFVSFCETHLYAIFSAICFSALISTAPESKLETQLKSINYENN